MRTGNITFGPALPLFDRVWQTETITWPPDDPIEARREAMASAFQHADKRWRDAYEAYVLDYLAKHGRATAERIRTAYEQTDLPQNVGKSKRASGGIFVRLRHQGKIRISGKEMSKLYGNELNEYELV